jgi:hypothetical protein
MIWPDSEDDFIYTEADNFYLCTLKDAEPWFEVYKSGKSFKGFWRTT